MRTKLPIAPASRSLRCGTAPYTAERINLFRHADVVIGPLGQGLSDILFCKPGTLFWEWMPQHHQNPSLNRLAQAAEVDYWGDLFESDTAPGASGNGSLMSIPLHVGCRRYPSASLFVRLPAVAPTPRVSGHRAPGKPIEELMLAFESLGDNCEFGLVQRDGGAEPLGLLRFAGMSLGNLVAALEAKLDGLGTIDTVTVYPAGEPGHRELMVHETC